MATLVALVWESRKGPAANNGLETKRRRRAQLLIHSQLAIRHSQCPLRIPSSPPSKSRSVTTRGWRKLAELQHDHVQQGQTEALLEVLAKRQEVLDGVARLEVDDRAGQAAVGGVRRKTARRPSRESRDADGRNPPTAGADHRQRPRRRDDIAATKDEPWPPDPSGDQRRRQVNQELRRLCVWEAAVADGCEAVRK